MSDDQLGTMSDAPSGRGSRLLSSNRRRIFGPSVTTTDEDSEMEALGNDSIKQRYLKPSTRLVSDWQIV